MSTDRPYISSYDARRYAMGHERHNRTCPVCGVLFDSRINLATSEHMEQGRPATYCSDTCQNTAEKRRSRSRA